MTGSGWIAEYNNNNKRIYKKVETKPLRMDANLEAWLPGKPENCPHLDSEKLEDSMQKIRLSWLMRVEGWCAKINLRYRSDRAMAGRRRQDKHVSKVIPPGSLDRTIFFPGDYRLVGTCDISHLLSGSRLRPKMS